MVLIQLTLDPFISPRTVRCGTCGLEEPFGPGTGLPASGGALEVRDGTVVDRSCGPCWAALPAGPSRAPFPLDPYPFARDALFERRKEEERAAEARAANRGWGVPPRRSCF